MHMHVASSHRDRVSSGARGRGIVSTISIRTFNQRMPHTMYIDHDRVTSGARGRGTVSNRTRV